MQDEKPADPGKTLEELDAEARLARLQELRADVKAGKPVTLTDDEREALAAMDQEDKETQEAEAARQAESGKVIQMTAGNLNVQIAWAEKLHKIGFAKRHPTEWAALEFVIAAGLRIVLGVPDQAPSDQKGGKLRPVGKH